MVLWHRNTMPQTQDMTPHPVTVYRHGADLSLCYPMMWKVTLEYTTTHLMSSIRLNWEILPRPSTHTPANAQLCNAVMVVVSQNLGRKSTVHTGSWTKNQWYAILLSYPLAHSCLYFQSILIHGFQRVKSTPAPNKSPAKLSHTVKYFELLGWRSDKDEY